MSIEPVVIWLSKGRVVVEQTYANLSPGGRYNHLLGPVNVATLAEYDSDTVRDATNPHLYFATVGTFNQKDKEQGDRLIFKTDIEDTAAQSTWQAIKERLNANKQRRPLLIVYDEAQNLSAQQTDLLLEPQPDAFIVASATMRIPQTLSDEIKRLKTDGWTQEDLITNVDPSAVVDAGLVKSTVLMAGYEAPMEETVSAMLVDLADSTAQAATYGLPHPKAIYVCKTNIVEGDAFRRDDPKRPFPDRGAPPIVIWRYLVDHHQIDPEKIAVYADLKFDRHYQPPPGFVLFGGADKDYERFTGGTTPTSSLTSPYKKAGTTRSATTRTWTRAWSPTSRSSRSSAVSCVSQTRTITRANASTPRTFTSVLISERLSKTYSITWLRNSAARHPKSGWWKPPRPSQSPFLTCL